MYGSRRVPFSLDGVHVEVPTALSLRSLPTAKVQDSPDAYGERVTGQADQARQVLVVDRVPSCCPCDYSSKPRFCGLVGFFSTSMSVTGTSRSTTSRRRSSTHSEPALPDNSAP